MVYLFDGKEALYPRFSEKEYQRRHQLLSEAMDKEGLDCLIILGHVAGVWSTGYTDGIKRAELQPVVIFPRGKEPIVASVFGDGGGYLPIRRPSPISYPVFIEELIKELRLENGKFGIAGQSRRARTPEELLPVSWYNHLVQKFPKASFKFLTNLISDLIIIKSDEEIRFIEKAAEIGDFAFETLIEQIKPGMKEYELVAILKYVIFSHGGDHEFVLLGGGPMATGGFWWRDVPSARVIRRGDIILNEIAPQYGFYSCQFSKPISIGEPLKSWKPIIDTALEAYKTIVNQLKPGKTLRDVQKAAAQVIKGAGFSVHSPLLHGIGIENEAPGLGLETASPSLDFEFKPNMTIIVEPSPVFGGIHELRNYKMGLMLNDTYVITETGNRLLGKYPAQVVVV